jgi:phosphoglycerate dehydrogenase-like enzyme
MPFRAAFLEAAHPQIKLLVESCIPGAWRMTFAASRSEADRREAAKGAEVAFIIGTGIDRELLAAAPHLRFVQKLGAGIDKIDRVACEERRVTVARLEAGNAVPVAEHTVLMMLAALRRLTYFDRRTREGAWLKEEGRGVQRQLLGKRVGLVGFGAIGREVAKRLRGFDVEIVYYDPFPAPASVEHEFAARRLELDDLLATSDVISLHLPLMPETRNLLDERRMALLKRDVTIVNCARGGLIDEAALERALARGTVHAVGLDTFATEPPGKIGIFTRDDVIVTPHLAGATYDNFEVVFRRGIRNVERFIAGEPIARAELVVDVPR